MSLKKLKIQEFSTNKLSSALAIRGGARVRMSHTTKGYVDTARHTQGTPNHWDDKRWFRTSKYNDNLYPMDR